MSWQACFWATGGAVVVWRAGRGGGFWAGGRPNWPPRSLRSLPPRGLSAPWGGPAVLRPTALRCSAVGRRRGTHCALPGAKLRSDSRAEFDVEVRLTAHRPPHGLRSSPPAKSPPPHPTRSTTWATGWCTDIFHCALGDRSAVCGYSAFTAAPAWADLAAG